MTAILNSASTTSTTSAGGEFDRRLVLLHREVVEYMRINGRRGSELPRGNTATSRRGKDQTHDKVRRKGFRRNLGKNLQKLRHKAVGRG